MTKSDKTGSTEDSNPTSTPTKKKRYVAANPRRKRKKKKNVPIPGRDMESVKQREIIAADASLHSKTMRATRGNRKRDKDQAIELLKLENKVEPGQMLGVDELKHAGESLNDASRKVLEAVLMDVMPECDDESGREITKGIKDACRRAQMGKSGDQVTFWRHVSDPGFLKIVKETGAALVGSHILPLIATLMNMAINDKNEWALKTCFQIAGLLPTKYDIYQLKYENTHTNVFSGEVNFGGKSDQELQGIISTVYDDAQEEEVVG